MPSQLPLEKQEEWKKLIQEQQASGLSIEQWCRDKGLRPHMFFYWRSRLFPKPKLNRKSFMEIDSLKDTGISIECNSIRIFLEKDFDPNVLKNCLKILKEFKC